MWLEKFSNVLAVMIAVLLLILVAYTCFKIDKLVWYLFIGGCAYTAIAYIVIKIKSKE